MSFPLAAPLRVGRLPPVTLYEERPDTSRLDETLELEFQRLKRYGTPFSLLLLDIDFFKNFNDHHGHVTGDACLVKVAGLIADAVSRPTDLAARYGGEEFAVILSGTDEEGAYSIAERIRQGVQGLAIPHRTLPAPRAASPSASACAPRRRRRASAPPWASCSAPMRSSTWPRNRAATGFPAIPPRAGRPSLPPGASLPRTDKPL